MARKKIPTTKPTPKTPTAKKTTARSGAKKSTPKGQKKAQKPKRPGPHAGIPADQIPGIGGRDHSADGKKGGAPAYYDTPEELQAAIDEYFETRKPKYAIDSKTGNVAADRYGNPIILERNPVTLTGLVLYVGFASIQSFDDTGKRDGFADVVTRARLRVAEFYEGNLTDPNIRAMGPTFFLEKMSGMVRGEKAVDDREAVDKHRKMVEELCGKGDDASG